jgi:spermidine/putrescine transport system substrate-binding protein
MDQPLTPPEGVHTRRTFLRLAGAAGLALGVGGSLGGPASAALAGNLSEQAVGGPFNLFTWAGYDGLAVPSMKAFYKKNNIQVNHKPITNEDRAAFILGPGGDKWDASSNNQGETEAFYDLDAASPVTVQEVPALAKMYPFFRNSSFFKIKDGTYNAVPWTWGPIGVTYRPDRVKASQIASWQDFLKPEFEGRLGTYDDALNMISIGAVATGLDPEKLTSAQLQGPVKTYLKKLRPNLKILSTSLGDQINVITAGDVDVELVGLTWYVNEGIRKGVKLSFMIPKEGTFGFIDCVFIPPTAPHRDNAIAYANALLEGQTAVGMGKYVNQPSTNPAVNARLPKSVLAFFPKNLVSFTSKLKWNKSYYKPGKYATIQEWSRVWGEVKAS